MVPVSVCARVVSCVSRVCPGSPRCLFTGKCLVGCFRFLECGGLDNTVDGIDHLSLSLSLSLQWVGTSSRGPTGGRVPSWGNFLNFELDYELGSSKAVK